MDYTPSLRNKLREYKNKAFLVDLPILAHKSHRTSSTKKNHEELYKLLLLDHLLRKSTGAAPLIRRSRVESIFPPQEGNFEIFELLPLIRISSIYIRNIERLYLFIYLGFYVAFNTVQVIS